MHASGCVHVRAGVHLRLPHLPHLRGLHGMEPGLHRASGRQQAGVIGRVGKTEGVFVGGGGVDYIYMYIFTVCPWSGVRKGQKLLKLRIFPGEKLGQLYGRCTRFENTPHQNIFLRVVLYVIHRVFHSSVRAFACFFTLQLETTG